MASIGRGAYTHIIKLYRELAQPVMCLVSKHDLHSVSRSHVKSQAVTVDTNSLA